MGSSSQEAAIKQMQSLMDNVEEPMKKTFQNMHQGYPLETFVRFLKARDWNVNKAYKMLVECLQWRIQNEIDDILAKPIVPTDFYRAIRDTQLIGISGYSREGLPIVAIGVGLSTYDKASVRVLKAILYCLYLRLTSKDANVMWGIPHITEDEEFLRLLKGND